ncbi:hypothetical protein HDE_12825 [Halotydeus destructor]|nr:hypothetical protein HDE_12825 [Halotydeus destructor]
MSSIRSLCDLDDDVIGVILLFAPHIWDVLNFTATCQRLNTLSERHLKTLKYLDLRIPYRENSESANIIEEGIKQLCLRRCGNQLTKIRFLKAERWQDDTEFIRSLKLLPETVMKLSDETEELDNLKYGLLSHDDTLEKVRTVIWFKPEMIALNAVVDKSDDWVLAGLRRDFITVKKLDIVFAENDQFEIHGIAKCCTYFPHLEALSFEFNESSSFEFDTFVTKTISLLSQIDDKVQLELSHWLILSFPIVIACLKDYLQRLHIYSPSAPENPFATTTYSKYQELETVLADSFYEKYREPILQSVSRVKMIEMFTDGAEKIISFHGHYTETLHLFVYHVKPLQRKQLFKCIKRNCPNFRHVYLDFYDDSEDQILDFFESFGHSMETVSIYFHEKGTLSSQMLLTILEYCPKLKSFDCNGKPAQEIEQYASLCEHFRRFRHLEYVKLKTGHDYTLPHLLSMVYCNGKMALTEEETSDE